MQRTITDIVDGSGDISVRYRDKYGPRISVEVVEEVTTGLVPASINTLELSLEQAAHLRDRINAALIAAEENGVYNRAGDQEVTR